MLVEVRTRYASATQCHNMLIFICFQVINKYESPTDLIMHKSPRHGNYHIETSDHLIFFEISIPDMTWPGEAWEVGLVLV